MIFFEVLKNLRNDSGLSLEELSDVLNIKSGKLKGYEFKKAYPPFEILKRLSNVFGVSIDYLLKGDRSKFIKNISLFGLAEKIDKTMLQDMGKVESYIDTFLYKGKTNSIYYDVLDYKFSDSFNNNFTEIIKQSGLTGKDIAKKLNVSERQISSYKKFSECSYDFLVKISTFFNISIHWLITGEKLFFDITNIKFKELILKADEQLKKDQTDTVIKLMQQILKNHNIK